MDSRHPVPPPLDTDPPSHDVGIPEDVDPQPPLSIDILEGPCAGEDTGAGVAVTPSSAWLQWLWQKLTSGLNDAVQAPVEAQGRGLVHRHATLFTHLQAPLEAQG